MVHRTPGGPSAVVSESSAPHGTVCPVPESTPDITRALLHRLVEHDPSAAAEVVVAAPTSGSPSLLVAAALLALAPELLLRAGALATTTRDRQLVALGQAYLAGETDRLDVLVREHLGEHPDNLLASWIAGRPPRP
jgi:hypothetical protein